MYVAYYFRDGPWGFGARLALLPRRYGELAAEVVEGPSESVWLVPGTLTGDEP